MFVLAFAIGALCFRALDLPDVSIIFGMAVMPLTYYPILKVAADTNAMKKHFNSRLDTWVATVFLVLITIAAAAAIPLTIVTHSGQR